MQQNFVNGDGIPMGFGMLLAQNEGAMERFAGLSPQEKQAVINGAKAVTSKAEMRDYVEHIAQNFPL